MSRTRRIGKSSLLKLGGLLVFIIAIVLVFRYTGLSISDFAPENLRNFLIRFGVWGPVVFIGIYSLRAIVVVIPVGAMSLAGGLAYGKWWGTVYILIGATLGACISFLLARYLGRRFIESFGWLHKGRIKSFDEGTEKHGFRMILFLRLVPLFQYDAINYGFGLSKMKFRDYAFGSLIGMAPGGFINAMLGSSLDNILSVQFFLALGIFILLMFAPAIYKAIARGVGAKMKRETVPEPSGELLSKERRRGECPGCSQKISPIAILVGWDKWGRFVCPGCGARIRFQAWFLAVIVLMGFFIGVERLLHNMLTADFPLWLSFLISGMCALLVMFLVPMVWPFRQVRDEK